MTIDDDKNKREGRVEREKKKKKKLKAAKQKRVLTMVLYWPIRVQEELKGCELGL